MRTFRVFFRRDLDDRNAYKFLKTNLILANNNIELFFECNLGSNLLKCQID